METKEILLLARLQSPISSLRTKLLEESNYSCQCQVHGHHYQYQGLYHFPLRRFLSREARFWSVKIILGQPLSNNNDNELNDHLYCTDFFDWISATLSNFEMSLPLMFSVH